MAMLVYQRVSSNFYYLDTLPLGSTSPVPGHSPHLLTGYKCLKEAALGFCGLGSKRKWYTHGGHEIVYSWKKHIKYHGMIYVTDMIPLEPHLQEKTKAQNPNKEPTEIF